MTEPVRKGDEGDDERLVEQLLDSLHEGGDPPPAAFDSLIDLLLADGEEDEGPA